jgi:S1-C subfamily serine protease
MMNREQLAQLAESLGGVPVWGVLPGSVSQRCGVRYGDVILSVNGIRTSSADEYVEARGARSDGADIVIFRDGHELLLQLEFDAPSAPTPERVLQVARELAAARLLPSDAPLMAKPETN